MTVDTQGWVPIYDVKDQCGMCAHVVKEHRMASCDSMRGGFPAAHNCPMFKYDWSDDDGRPV
jgi:hypothetical protein